jgi:hypothetical protein
MMHQIATTNVSRAEWRWVIIFGGLLVSMTLLPYAWAFTSSAGDTGAQFMGILYNPQDGATYLSKIRQGEQGASQWHLAHTPEPHDGAFLQVFYLLLGHLARLLGLSPLLMFHVARLVTSFMMYIAIYHLGSTIWQRMRPRRLFFGMLAIGSGLGWLALVVTRNASDLAVDLTIPEAIPLYATFVNPHFPLTIGLIALLASMFVVVFRPGFDAEPTATNGGGSVALISLALSLIQPQGWLPIAASLCAYLVVLAARARRIPRLELNWVLLVILPALPVLIYYLATVNINTAMRIWNEQNQTPSPAPLLYAIGFGLLLVVALPGVWRALRRFERDGDRFMLVWLAVNAALLYAPFNLQRRLAIGLIIPIVYFGVRALEDYWFQVISPRWRDAVLLTFFVFIVPSNVIAFGLPLVGIADQEAGIDRTLLLPDGYADAIRWLARNAPPGAVVLAPSGPSLWIPAYTNLRVVYGHPFETLNAADKQAAVAAWYRGDGCRELVDRYAVQYVLARAVSPDDPGPGWPQACLNALALDHPIQTFGDVQLYQLPAAR